MNVPPTSCTAPLFCLQLSFFWGMSGFYPSMIRPHKSALAQSSSAECFGQSEEPKQPFLHLSNLDNATDLLTRTDVV